MINKMKNNNNKQKLIIKNKMMNKVSINKMMNE